MSTRFKPGSKRAYEQSPLPTGYEKTSGLPDLSIPSCGIEDVDTALFSLFDKEIAPEIGKSDDLKKVPIIFAAGEKWALLKRGRPLRDRNNTLILPLITIMRTDLTQTMSEDVAGRGINQQVGEIVIRRKLDKSDRDYQSLINKYLLTGQQNVAVRPNDPKIPDQAFTERKVGSLYDKVKRSGAYLSPNLKNNIYETLVVPTPQFYTAKYQITVWTQYTQHTNQIVEKIFSSFLPQAQSWKLETPKGYWFVAKVEEGSFATETNFDDMSNAERFIKNTMTVTVPAYFFASSAPGMPVPIKRYVSSPIISFDSATADISEGSEQEDSQYSLGSDDPTLPMSLKPSKRRDQRDVGVYYVTPDVKEGKPAPISANDPAAEALPRGYTIKVVNKNAKGETVFKGASLGGLDIILTDDISDDTK